MALDARGRAGASASTKFSLLFAGMAAGMPAGLSSLVLQSQAVFTVIFAVLLLRERPGEQQIAGLAVAAAGIGRGRQPGSAFLAGRRVPAGRRRGGGLGSVQHRDPPGVAAGHAALHGVGQRGRGAAAGPALAARRGPGHATWPRSARPTRPASALCSSSRLISTLAGFGGWGYLIRRYGASTVAPFSMLVPIFGIASAALLLGGADRHRRPDRRVLVVGGVLLGLLGGRPPGRRGAGELTAVRGAATLTETGRLERVA